MTKKIIWLVVSCLMAVSLVIASCGPAVVEEEEEEEEEMMEEEEEEEEEEVEEVETPEGPQYGGTFTDRLTSDPVAWDPYVSFSVTSCSMYYECLGMGNYMEMKGPADDVDFRGRFWPIKHVKGMLAESWETTDFQTITFHMRKGVHWQDIPPLNGRELTAYDIEFTFQRILGMGYGYDTAVPHSRIGLFAIESVEATDKDTLVFKFTKPSWDQLRDITYDLQTNMIVPQEAVEQWGDVNDWRHAIGTGPFILEDYVTGSCITFVRNPDYWGYDERYPENQLPYFDTVKQLVIADDSTAQAGIRTGKIDRLSMIAWEDVELLKKTYPEVRVTPNFPEARAIWMRVDNEYFKDIRVRSAMQMAVDLETIAETYYGGYGSGDPSGPVGHPGWKTLYSEWPQELKDRYLYNPDEAKKLLAEAGYPDGFKTELAVSVTQDVDLIHVVQAYLADIGVEVSVKPMEYGSWLSYVQGGHATHMSYSLRGVHSSIPAPAIIRYYTTTHTHSPAHNVTDPHINELYSEMEGEVDEEALMLLVQEADLYCASQQWQIVLPTTQLYLIEQPWVKGRAVPIQNVIASGQKFSRYWIDQELKKDMGY